MVPVRDFKRFLQDSRCGERFLYHIGFLLADRQHDKELDRIANLVWDAHLMGLVELKQKVETNGTHYIATRTSYRPRAS